MVSERVGAPQFLPSDEANEFIDQFGAPCVSLLEGKAVYVRIADGLLILDGPCLV